MFRLISLSLCNVLLVAQSPSPQEREFDFWVGEWNVQNRQLGNDAGFRNAGLATARIRPEAAPRGVR